ncbi:MAG TPA: response regulator [Candidatus Handelsmanbacteria bacterium]|nr:response regulator [Candidatus Handelsmanbacteria bacterium]
MEKVSVRPLGGIEVLRQLHEQTHNIPVILVTAYSDLDSVQRAWGLQVIDYERKPIRVAELKQRLGKYLGAAPSKA